MGLEPRIGRILAKRQRRPLDRASAEYLAVFEVGAATAALIRHTPRVREEGMHDASRFTPLPLSGGVRGREGEA